MTPAQLLSQLKKWGVKYKEYEDWEEHNRNHKGPWGPVYGFMWHHTGTDNKDQRLLLRKGYSELPGPLCHFGIAQDGTCWLIGWGRANHAGSGDDDVLRAVINESRKPTDDEANTDGNRHFYGAEFWYSGNHAMTQAQYETGILLSCAINDFHGWNEESEIGHGEWQPGKWDPGIRSGDMEDMNRVRRDIAARQKMGPKPVASNNQKTQTYREVWDLDVAPAPKGHDTGGNKYRAPISLLVWIAEQQDVINKKLDEIMKRLDG
ncbi:peptidoglycan recognition protein family protein [Streptomyces rochei]|uniref:peptidoglycan recognition protein family protein n=1 Tax=Streptomyces rochei TaxID=1928 RepID=UPI0036C4FFDE